MLSSLPFIVKRKKIPFFISNLFFQNRNTLRSNSSSSGSNNWLVWLVVPFMLASVCFVGSY